MANPSSPSSDSVHFSTGAVSALREALSSHASPSSAPVGRPKDDFALRAALTTLCEEAHSLHLGPEAMVIALKSAWSEATRGQSPDREAAAAAYAQMLSLCIETYYSSRA